MNSTGLNCTDAYGNFSVVSITVVNGLWLAESIDAKEPWKGRADYVIHRLTP